MGLSIANLRQHSLDLFCSISLFQIAFDDYVTLSMA